MNFASGYFKWAVCLVIPAYSIGCGPGKGDLKGKVTYGNKTVKVGEVIIIASDGQSRVANIDREGNFEFKDLVGGEAKAAVMSMDPRKRPPVSREKSTPDAVDVKNWFPIHPDYANHVKSGLNFVIRSGGNVQNLEMAEKQGSGK